MEKQHKIILLAVDCAATNILYHYLSDFFEIEQVIVEEAIPRKRLLKRRTQTLGYPTVIGQVLFQLLKVPILKRQAQNRLKAIKQEYQLNDQAIPESKITRVTSVNTPACRKQLRRIQPKVVVVSGTRIIGKRTITSVKAPFINMHAGITPLYRGIHGGYWAMKEGKPHLFGVTVHEVDKGIDTGKIIEQAYTTPHPDDNYCSYPLLQQAIGLPLMQRAVAATLADDLQFQDPPEGESKLWSHPTLF